MSHDEGEETSDLATLAGGPSDYTSGYEPFASDGLPAAAALPPGVRAQTDLKWERLLVLRRRQIAV